jgi:WD40 repeat protein/serine/threonine protein kinase
LLALARPDDETRKDASATEPLGGDASGQRERRAGAPESAPPQAGAYRDYVVKGEHGRGGLGRVLRAHDRRLDRPVAIKELLSQGLETSDGVARFLREARLTAQLQHPSIVPVYEIGFRDDGAPFYAMKLIVGESFDVIIARSNSLAERLGLLPNVLALAEALAYAHDRRIIHRDIKPSNVIVGAFGETVVIDWGVAKDLGAKSPSGDGDRPANSTVPVSSESASGAALGDTILALGDTSGARTHAGRMLGTLGYMPPEQFRGDEVDARADVFALGAFLYHTVTGTGPYESEPSAILLDRIARGAVRPVESREPGVPPDLAAIVRKAMSPSPADRYPTAKELAADLKRFLTGQLVSAHAYSRRVLFARWLARNRRVVSVATAFAIALGVTGVVSVRGIVRERDRAEKERSLAEKERALAEGHAQALTLVQARSSLDRDPTASLAWLKTATFDDASRDEILSIAADAQARGVARVVLNAPGLGELNSPLMSPDGERVYAGPEQNGLVEWNLALGNRLRLVPTPMLILDFAPTTDGALTLAGSLDGPILDLDLRTGAHRILDAGHGKVYTRAARGAALGASCADDGTVREWNMTTGEGKLLGTEPVPCSGLDLSPDATSVATMGVDRVVRIWSTLTGSVRAIKLDRDEGRIDWSSDGSTLVASAGDPSLAIDVSTGKWKSLAGSGDLNASAAIPGTKSWVGGDTDGALHVWDLATGASQPLRGHTTNIHTVAPLDATTILSCADEGTARIWDLRNGSAFELRGHSGLKDCRFARQGRSVLTAGNDGMVRVWDLPDKGLTRAIAGHAADVYAVAFSRDGSLIATGADDRTVRIWNVATGASFALEGHTDIVEGVAFLDDTHVASSSDDDTVRVWNLGDRSSVVLPHTMRVIRVAPTRDGRSLLTSCTDGLVRIWDVARREAVVLRGHIAAADYAELSPDEERVVTAGEDGTVRVWDRHTGAQLMSVNALTSRVTGAQFVGGGSALVASSGGDGAVRIWDVATGALVRTMTGHTDRIRFLGVSADGRRIVTASNDHTARVWDVASGAFVVLKGHAAEVRRAEISPDGRWVVTSSYDKTSRVWDSRTGRLLQLVRAGAPVMRSAFSPDATLVAAVGFDRLLHLARVDAARFLPSEAGPFRAWLEATTSGVVEGGEVASPSADSR